MINHFRTHLLNQPASFFAGSLFTVFTNVDFVPATHTVFTRRINNALFGETPDATLLDFRFFQFLRIIRSRDLLDHTRRFDSRITYKEDGEYDFTDPVFYSPVITPLSGLQVYETKVYDPGQTPEPKHEIMRVVLDVVRDESGQLVVTKGDEELSVVSDSETQFTIPHLGLTVMTDRPGTWVLDFRRIPSRRLPGVISAALSLSEDVYASLFEQIRDDTPEYEKGFREVTDQVHRFCMLLFAQAVFLEKQITAPPV
jgi:hypothetical protein